MKRLDRLAQKLSVGLSVDGARRSFPLNGRVITYYACGKGAFMIESSLDGVLDAVGVGGEQRIEELLLKASKWGT
jgi:hypothetical protein